MKSIIAAVGTLAAAAACIFAVPVLAGDNDVLFWDTRSEDEYTGARANNLPPERTGHIPRAIHLEWSELTDPATGMFRPADEMREVLAAKGITPEKEVVTY